jgi:hypothetical protein
MVTFTLLYCKDYLDFAFGTLWGSSMIPGVVIIEPDYPELKDAWPFLWYENEYVVDAANTFILAPNAAEALTHSSP